MIDISIKDVVKAYDDGVNILDGLSFDVQAGEHIGILGKNGGGKTTLFRLLTKEIRPDSGEIMIAPGKSMGLISQIPNYPKEYTTEDVLKTAFSKIFSIEKKMAELSEKMATEYSDSIMKEYDRLTSEFQRLGGYDMDFRLGKVANGLDIPEAMRKRLFSQLSGGEKTRVNLARLILEDTDILLLDEPTNHLDLHATEWLEDYILHFRGTVLSISHDRWYLDTIAQRIIEIGDGKAEFYSGNYSFFVEERQRRFDEQMKKYEKDRAKLEQLQRAAEQMHLWAFMGNDKLHKRAFSMEKRIDKLSQTEKPGLAKKMTAGFKETDFNGDEVFVLDGVSKSFGEKKLFSELTMLIKGGDRIALIGDNGTGKSTLIKILLGEEIPDGGYVKKGPSVKLSCLPQIISFEDESRTLYDTMLWDGNCAPQEARNRLGQFMFPGENVFKSVSALSGGEKSRLKLCIIMKDDINFLILDEPTNHLDIASREWIEDAVMGYGGALLFVSHDRWFIEKFANRIWELENGEITDYRGSFSEFREFKKRAAAIQRAAAPAEPAPEKKKAEKKPRTGSSEKQRNKLEKEISRLEEEIASLEKEALETGSDYKRLIEIEAEKEEKDLKLLELYEAWEALE